MNLPFFAADTLGVSLYQAQGDILKGHEIHRLPLLSSWRVDTPIDVTSDVWSTQEVGAWVTLGKHLRCYLAVREKESWLFVLDAEVLQQIGAATGFAGVTVKARVGEIKPAIRGQFRWKGDCWERVAMTV